MQKRLQGSVPLVVVGFSPPEALALLADSLGLGATMLSDPERVTYRLLGLPRAPLRQVYSPGTLVYYASAALRGRKPHKPVEDTRQLGGDALVYDGAIVGLWRPSTPDDRVAPRVIAAAARGHPLG